MKNWSTLFLCCLFGIAFLLLNSCKVFANDLNFSTGLNVLIKGHYDSNDDFHKYTDEKAPGYYAFPLLDLNGYFEWYVFGDLGFGLNFIYLTEDSYYMDSSEKSPFAGYVDNKYDSQIPYSIQLSNYLLTSQYIIFGSQSYLRSIIAVGLGFSEYRLDGDKDTPYYTSGYGVLTNLILDWGGKYFGGRVGVMHLTTNYDDLKFHDKTLNVDTSFRSFYAGLRAAW